MNINVGIRSRGIKADLFVYDNLAQDVVFG